MSVGLSETDNYIWNTEAEADYLGEGAFGKVYLGVHKKTGNKVAVKTFKYASHTISQETKMLQTLKHQYIIQLYGIEYETISRSTVMIMEYCNGGSLHKFLSEPENVYGLGDNEFLLVLEHLSGGLEYLKRHDVIHRDVKPDNIMRHILYDGRTIYKLADFGAARELPEGQYFNSLHGTEPYLNPKLYKVCFFRDAAFKREFDSNTDLWSIGVTLYQIATGTLPFRVQERHVMLTIYNEMNKNPGIISATQQLDSDRVVYQKKLPLTCNLSTGLKDLLTPLIAGLLMQERTRQWSFTSYYNSVLELVAAKPVDVFYVNKMEMLKVYMRQDENFNHFKRYIHEQTNITEKNQIYFFDSQVLVSSYQGTLHTSNKSIFLFDRAESKIKFSSNLVALYETSLRNFITNFSKGDGTEDLRLVFIACKDLCFLKKHLEYQAVAYKHFRMLATDFDTFCSQKIAEHHKTVNQLREKYESIGRAVTILNKIETLAKTTAPMIPKVFDLETVTGILNDITRKKATFEVNSSHDSLLQIVDKELKDMKTLYKRLYKCKHHHRLYEYEKIKIIHCVIAILEIVNDKMMPDFENFIENSGMWFENIFLQGIRSLATPTKVLLKLKGEMEKYESEIHNKSCESIDLIARDDLKKCNQQQVRATLMLYGENNTDSNPIVEENDKLASKMQRLMCDLTLCHDEL